MTGRRKAKWKTTRAPLLANGQSRVKLYGRLPDEVKEGLRGIAMAERKSMSWVIEEVIIDYFVIDMPKYKTAVRPVLTRGKNVLPMRRKA